MHSNRNSLLSIGLISSFYHKLRHWNAFNNSNGSRRPYSTRPSHSGQQHSRAKTAKITGVSFALGAAALGTTATLVLLNAEKDKQAYK